MLFHATTRMNQLRGNSTDAYGDEVDAQILIAEGIPAHLTETQRTARQPSTGTPLVIRGYTCRLPARYDIQPGDRLEDTSTGVLYSVDAATRPAPGSPVSDLRADLRRIS
jgi:hypothetical protein